MPRIYDTEQRLEHRREYLRERARQLRADPDRYIAYRLRIARNLLIRHGYTVTKDGEVE